MTTNPTPKQQEEARELPRWSDCEAAIDDKRATPLERFIYEYEPGDNDDLWRERLQAALSSRDQEIREVLEGLRVEDGDCWCAHFGSEYHTPACLAARGLYEKLNSTTGK